MTDEDGSIVTRNWAVGFALGITVRSKEWGRCILLTEHRQVLLPILVYCEGELDLLPDMPAAESADGKPPPTQRLPGGRRRARHLQSLS